MPTVTYREPSGAIRTIDASVGDTLMELALEHDVDGIIGECGGNAMCATCHVYVDEDHLDNLPQMKDAEDAMLEFTIAPRYDNSRLGCQITVCDRMDGLTVTVPEGLS